VVDPLVEYYEGVKGLIRGRCGDGVVLILSPPLTWADKLVDELAKELGKDRVRHYIIGSRSGREEAKSLTDIIKRIKNPVKESKPLVGILKRIRDSIRRGEGLVIDEELMSELRDLLGDELVGGVKPDCIIPYYISWEEARRYASDENVDEKVRKALMLIINGFEGRGRRITWFGLDYVPEELVEEVKSAKSEDVEGWIKAYLSIVSKLNLDGGVSYEVKNVFKRFIEPIKASLTTIGKVMHVVPEFYTRISTLIVAVALSLIDSLTKDEKFAFRGIIDAVTRLKALRSGGDLNTLGKLIAYKLAVDMGVSYEVVHNVLIGFAGLADDVLGVIEERLDINLIKSQSIEGAFRVYDKGGFESNAEAHPGISIRGNELLIRGSVIGGSALETYRVVTTRGFNDLRNEVLKRLDNEGVVVLVGPRGIGKTTLATYATWTLFKEGKLRFMTNVKSLPEEKGTEFTDFIGYYLGNKYDDKYGNLLVVYDPSTTKTYSRADKKTEVPKGISNTIDTLLKSIAEDEKVRGRVRLLVVLPTDIHQALPQDLKDRLGKYVLDLEEKGFLRDPEFLAAVVMEYARGCSIDYGEARALADEILGRFSEGYTLIARLTGTLIASRYECRVDDVKRIIEESRGDAHYFILRYINALFKVHKDPSIAETLVEVFALRKPLINEVGPGAPILTPGIIGLIGEEKKAKTLYGAEGRELRSWLTYKQHDLIEDSIEKLLKCIANEVEECKKLDTALEPWRLKTVRESLRKVSEEVKDVRSAIDYFTNNYGEKLIDALREDYSNCWRRAALIIGHALAGYDSVPSPEDLPSDVVESLGDALNECKIASNLSIDDYLLVDNKIPPLIMNLVLNNTRILTEALYDNIIIKTKIKIITHTYALAEAFVDKYNEAVADVNRILKIARKRGIYGAEMFYGLGLSSIIAKAAGSVKPGDADAALHIAPFTIQRVASTDLIKSVLGALEPLRGKAPLGYLKLLVSALSIENLDSDTVKYIFYELNEILDDYGDVVKEHAWSLVHAIIAYADLLWVYRSYFEDEVKGMVARVADLLNELNKFKTSLGVIAWAYALAPALEYEDIMKLMMETLRINEVDKVIDKASEILEELGRLRKKVKELIRDEEFMGYIESKSVKADEEAVKKEILEAASALKHALAIYRLNNDELKKAAKLFNETAKEIKEIAYENYLINSGWALRVEAIKGSLVGDELVKLVDGFRQLYEEAFNKERFSMPTARYLSIASGTLGNYLVSLALAGDYETISKLLEKHLWVLNAYGLASVLTRLMLNALLRPRGELNSELKGKLGVNPEELINAFGPHMHSEFLPALRVALGITKPDMYAISVAMNDNAAVVQLRGQLINAFQGLLSKKLGLLKELGADVDELFNEFKGLVNGLDGKSLAQLIAPRGSMALLALMLRALINGDEELAKAHALYGAVYATEKLPARLFLEAYRACCDPNNDEFRRAIARLFFYHI
jgi:hypothetical protein